MINGSFERLINQLGLVTCMDISHINQQGKKLRKLMFAQRMLAPRGNITEFDKHWILGMIKLASI